MVTNDPAGYKMPNGKHVGEKLTRVPVGYLKWMANSNRDDSHLAQAEMRRRGTITPTLEISGHSIDRASTRLIAHWRKGRADTSEGLWSWLGREASAAWADHERRRVPGPAVTRNGVKFVFSLDGVWPTLKTVVAVKRRDRQSDTHPDDDEVG